jgi:hypothetical protein
MLHRFFHTYVAFQGVIPSLVALSGLGNSDFAELASVAYIYLTIAKPRWTVALSLGHEASLFSARAASSSA